MQLLSPQKVVALVVFCGAVHAVPVAPDDTTEVMAKRDWINDCGNSNFINQSSGGSPRVSDCQQIVRNIAGGGTWKPASGGAFHTLATYGTCAFGVDSRGGSYAHIGNSDISDLINDSIKKFTYRGLVGAKGTMPCQGDTGGSTVNWYIYHT